MGRQSRQLNKGLSRLEFAAIVGIVAVLLVAFAIPFFQWQFNIAGVDSDHSNIRQAYSMLQRVRITDTSPVDGSDLPKEGDPITFYYLTGSMFAQEGDKYHPVPDRAYVLQGNDGRNGAKCNLVSAGVLQPGVPDPDTVERGTSLFCGAHLRGNYIKLIYSPGGGGGNGAWLLALEGTEEEA